MMKSENLELVPRPSDHVVHAAQQRVQGCSASGDRLGELLSGMIIYLEPNLENIRALLIMKQ